VIRVHIPEAGITDKSRIFQITAQRREQEVKPGTMVRVRQKNEISTTGL
jgi:hypothetical protein